MNVELQIALGVLGGLGTIGGGIWALMKTYAFLVGKLVEQFKAVLDTRFEAMETARQEGRKILLERLEKIEARYEQLDRELRKLLIEMPRDYVARTDYVRRETVIEAKIDQLALRWENWMLKREASQ